MFLFWKCKHFMHRFFESLNIFRTECLPLRQSMLQLPLFFFVLCLVYLSCSSSFHTFLCLVKLFVADIAYRIFAVFQKPVNIWRKPSKAWWFVILAICSFDASTFLSSYQGINVSLEFSPSEFDKTRMKLFSNSSRHHLINQTNYLKTYLSSGSNILQVGSCLCTVSIEPLIFKLTKYFLPKSSRKIIYIENCKCEANLFCRSNENIRTPDLMATVQPPLLDQPHITVYTDHSVAQLGRLSSAGRDGTGSRQRVAPNASPGIKTFTRHNITFNPVNSSKPPIPPQSLSNNRTSSGDTRRQRPKLDRSQRSSVSSKVFAWTLALFRMFDK